MNIDLLFQIAGVGILIFFHVFTEEARQFYALERLWADAERVDLKDIIVEEPAN